MNPSALAKALASSSPCMKPGNSVEVPANIASSSRR